MTERKDGGPAFPLLTRMKRNVAADGADEVLTSAYWPGLTLRDYFAAKALTGMCATAGSTDYEPKIVAQWAYEHADAMLRERARLSQENTDGPR